MENETTFITIQRTRIWISADFGGIGNNFTIKESWTLAAIAQVLPTFTDLALETQIIAEAAGQDATWSPAIKTTPSSVPLGNRQINNLAEDAVMLLAQGILRQYDWVLLGRDIVRQQDNTLPSELYKAMCKLGRLYIEEGLTDSTACVHTVLDRARYPLDSENWNLGIFRQSDFRFSQVTLIDPDLRVPTSDCAEVANLSGAFGEDNVIEHRLYSNLCQATERLGSRGQHQAYTALRELFGRYSLIGERQLLDYLVENDLTPLPRDDG
ncbi:hypothetical protein LC653_09335 [Nostoc sp. CHAB 5784]|uniref:hypothetical protein n=1 Tax=Nostoc mirabile TaxID=2907820 RepID=UPI001E355481|nr:hypothetical protein [Nostoc mirabile]MCC5664116.1 hypothetical protein [Nostoc mirabile CHAB5784]